MTIKSTKVLNGAHAPLCEAGCSYTV